MGEGSVNIEVDAGLVCDGPDQALSLMTVTLSSDGNEYPTLHFQDPNDPGVVTGYNIYRSSDASLPVSSWSLLGSDVTDEDGLTPDIQWTDTTGDVAPTGIWFYVVRAVNSLCGGESP
jgi:hypothetical protein